MMLLVLFSTFFSLSQTFAFAPSYDGRPEFNIVLGVDKTSPPDESPLRFPCTNTMGHVTCGQIRFENKTCENTFFVDRLVNKIELSCLIAFKKVVIAHADARGFNVGSSQSRYGFYALKLMPNVSFKRDIQGHSFVHVNIR